MLDKRINGLYIPANCEIRAYCDVWAEDMIEAMELCAPAAKAKEDDRAPFAAFIAANYGNMETCALKIRLASEDMARMMMGDYSGDGSLISIDDWDDLLKSCHESKSELRDYSFKTDVLFLVTKAIAGVGDFEFRLDHLQANGCDLQNPLYPDLIQA